MTYPPIYSVGQQRVLGYLPLITAPFSVCGSFLIIYSILADRKKTLKSVYHRLMLGMSMIDFVTSLSMVIFDPWAVPKEASYYFVDAKGSFPTCAASGFFFNLLFGTMWYSAFLAVYFLLLISLEWKERTLARWLEPIAHFISTMFPITIGLYAGLNENINPLDILPGWCWTVSYPPGCYTEGATPENSDQEMCQRGMARRRNFLVAISLFIVIVVCMLIMIWKVRDTELRIQRYATGGRTCELRRTKETAKQALFYIAAFFVALFPMTMVQMLHHQRYKRYYFVFALMAKFCAPLQGFLNSIVYLRPRFRTLVDDGGSLWFLLKISAIKNLYKTSPASRNGASSCAAAEAPIVSNVSAGPETNVPLDDEFGHSAMNADDQG